MQLKVFFVTVAICVAPCAFAEGDASQQRKTYFLIDASGSMEKRQDKLDAALEAKRQEIKQARLVPPIETRFGGENGGVCGAPIELGKSDIGAFSNHNDNTPLGAALETALQAVGNGKADIFIFTDEEQTPGCGPDICTVAERYLPKQEDVFVQSIPIDSAPIDHVKLSCIRSAQLPAQQVAPFLEASINVQNVDTTQNETPPNQDFTINWSPIHFIEKWLWLIGFCCVAFSAMLWGQQRQKLAVDKETATTKLDRLRMAALVEGNEPARNQLKGEIATINESLDQAVAEKKKFGQQHWRQRYPKRLQKFLSDLRWHWVGVFGLSLLIALPLLSKGMAIGDFSIGRAQLHAWEALDSSFAEAFSLVAIAIVFFAGSQFRRQNEAIQKYELATEKAAWAQVHLQAQQRGATTAAYAKARKDLKDLKIQLPSTLFRIRRHSRKVSPDDVNFSVIIEAAREHAFGTPLDFANVDAKEIEGQTAIINEIVAGTVLWTDPFHLNDAARFLALVLKRRPEAFATTHQALWESLVSTLNKPSYAQSVVIARQLAPALLLTSNEDATAKSDTIQPA